MSYQGINPSFFRIFYLNVKCCNCSSWIYTGNQCICTGSSKCYWFWFRVSWALSLRYFQGFENGPRRIYDSWILGKLFNCTLRVLNTGKIFKDFRKWHTLSQLIRLVFTMAVCPFYIIFYVTSRIAQFPAVRDVVISFSYR